MAVRVRTVLLTLLVIVVLLVAVVLTAIGWEVVLGPKARPTTARRFDATAERLARGKYIAEGPAACFHCHSPHDFTKPDYPILQDRKGSGWEMPIPELGKVYARNITPDPETGLGQWTDDEIARAIREGVSRDGTAMFPVMPYLNFALMSDDDVAAVVVYLRTLAPVRNAMPRSELIFPLNFIVKTIPQPITDPVPAHASGTAVERGEYLVTLAGCKICHTPADDRGQPLPGLTLGGGEPFRDPGANMNLVASVNITQDPSGIAHYDEALFLEVIRSGQLSNRTLSHVMPFEFFKNMTDDDIRDIFAFLKAQPPVKHRVSNTEPPTPCPVCKKEHGLGELNAAAKK
jgi:mono/diheme cytochrome c family protein